MGTIPSLDELKKKCLKQRIDPDRYRKAYAIYYGLFVTHFFSIRIVRFLYNKPVTPNMVTFFSIMISFLSAVFFSFGTNIMTLAGAVAFELFYILDSVDGQLARAKGLSSPGGKYLDMFCNFLVVPVVITGIVIALLKNGLNIPYLLFLSAGIYALVIIQIIDLLKLLLLLLDKNGEKPHEKGTAQQHPMSSLKLGYSLIHRSCTMPIIMHIVTVAALVNLFFEADLMLIPCVYFSIVGTFVWVSKLIYIAIAGYDRTGDMIGN